MIKKLKKNQNTEQLLPDFLNDMALLYYDYSYIKLALQYYTCYEIYEDCNPEEKTLVAPFYDKINELVKEEICEEATTNSEENLKKIDKLRSEMIELMQNLTAYTDGLQLFEYIINRMEFSFEEEVEKVDSWTLSHQTFQFIFNKKDNALINDKIRTVVSQLPVRITKKRFFDILNDSFSVYNGTTRDNLKSFLYMLRTSSMLDEVKLVKGFEDLFDFVKELSEADYSNVTKENYKRWVDMLTIASEKLNSFVDILLSLQEVINQIYTIILTKKMITTKEEEVEVSKSIISIVFNQFTNQTEEDYQEKTFDLLGKLEGTQEECYEKITVYESALYDFDQTMLMARTDLAENIEIIDLCIKLSSNSLFISFEQLEDDLLPVDTSYLFHERDQFIEELDDFFKNHHKSVNRAVMAAILGNIPVFFNNQEEIKEYIEYALVHCNNQSELKATAIILETLMNET